MLVTAIVSGSKGDGQVVNMHVCKTGPQREKRGGGISGEYGGDQKKTQRGV